MNQPTNAARLLGRHALVTGAAGGIGQAIVARLLTEGAQVVAADRSMDQLQRRSGEVAGAAPRLVAADLESLEAGRRLVDEAWNSLGNLDILVNCAGVYPSCAALELDPAELDRVLAVNLRTPFFMTQHFACRLVSAGRPGHVVNITSGNAERPRSGASAYAISKAGLEMATKALALELAPFQIHVNAVSPGFIDVKSEVNPLSEDYVAAISRTIPWPRPGSPADIAGAVAFLCGPDSEWITGAMLRVDGGRALGNTTLPTGGAPKNPVGAAGDQSELKLT